MNVIYLFQLVILICFFNPSKLDTDLNMTYYEKSNNSLFNHDLSINITKSLTQMLNETKLQLIDILNSNQDLPMDGKNRNLTEIIEKDSVKPGKPLLLDRSKVFHAIGSNNSSDFADSEEFELFQKMNKTNMIESFVPSTPLENNSQGHDILTANLGSTISDQKALTNESNDNVTTSSTPSSNISFSHNETHKEMIMEFPNETNISLKDETVSTILSSNNVSIPSQKSVEECNYIIQLVVDGKISWNTNLLNSTVHNITTYFNDENIDNIKITSFQSGLNGSLSWYNTSICLLNCNNLSKVHSLVDKMNTNYRLVKDSFKTRFQKFVVKEVKLLISDICVYHSVDSKMYVAIISISWIICVIIVLFLFYYIFKSYRRNSRKIYNLNSTIYLTRPAKPVIIGDELFHDHHQMKSCVKPKQPSFVHSDSLFLDQTRHEDTGKQGTYKLQKY